VKRHFFALRVDGFNKILGITGKLRYFVRAIPATNVHRSFLCCGLGTFGLPPSHPTEDNSSNACNGSDDGEPPTPIDSVHGSLSGPICQNSTAIPKGKILWAFPLLRAASNNRAGGPGAAPVPWSEFPPETRPPGWPHNGPAGYNKVLQLGNGWGAIKLGAGSSEDLEQVHVRGMIRRSLRPEAVAGLGIALAMSVFAPVVSASTVSTETTLSVSTQDQGSRTKATLSVNVAGKDGSAATGAVAIQENGKTVASVALDSTGQGTANVTLPAGAHNLRAVYAGDSSHTTSASAQQGVTAMASATPTYTLSLTAVSPSSFPMTLTAGSAGTVKVTVVPANNSSLTAPMFVTLSCSGLPDQSSCSFSPATVEILSTTTTATAPTATMVVQTQASGTAKNVAPAGKHSSTVAWAILLPGMVGLGGLAFGARRRRWLSRLALLGFVALVTTLGTTGCNPQYGYYHHGPDVNLPTPAGSYTITVTGQSSDGITSSNSSTTMALVVQ